MAGILNPVEPPALPLGTNEYSRPYQDQLNNIQRLFYNRLTNATNTLVGANGGAYLQMPHAMLMSDQDQVSGGTTVANSLTYNQPVILQGIEVRNGSEIWFDLPGQYLVTFTLQVTNRSNADQVFEVWAGFNGSNYPLSNTRFDIPARKSESVWSHIVPAISGIFTVTNPDTDYLTIKWWASSTLVFIEHYAAGTNPTRPEIPSVIMTVNCISRLP
jgi:hypothetical protein